MALTISCVFLSLLLLITIDFDLFDFKSLTILVSLLSKISPFIAPRRLASKYVEMKYNGHTHSLRSEINEKWKKK